MTKRAKTLARFEEKFIPEPNTGCWLWIGCAFRQGYGSFKVAGKVVSAHRFAWELYLGENPGPLHVLHRCDVRCCVNPDHLFLGTHQDNMDDMARKGRAVPAKLCGEANGFTHLSAADVRWIKGNVRPGILSQRAAAAKFGITQGTIHNIVSGRTWSHIK